MGLEKFELIAELTNALKRHAGSKFARRRKGNNNHISWHPSIYSFRIRKSHHEKLTFQSEWEEYLSKLESEKATTESII